jgi:hypothetical protein
MNLRCILDGSVKSIDGRDGRLGSQAEYHADIQHAIGKEFNFDCASSSASKFEHRCGW